jgi:hypothetical protein
VFAVGEMGYDQVGKPAANTLVNGLSDAEKAFRHGNIQWLVNLVNHW